ncbi:ribonuclease III [Caldimonas sp. KR1-144]|uniref:ribonuclease III n=1 Tax=Caldimonas sp. KR1-144 TaxID=3400911 RepID=UPI003C0C5250
MAERSKPRPALPDGLAALEQRLGQRFSNTALLQRAMTHKSFGAEHNERLEFLGDAVLAAAISGLLYARFPDAPEGDLTRVRAHLVREESLHRIALELGLSPLLRMSEGEQRSGGGQRASILADALEALIGAVQIDAGFEAARALVEQLFAPRLEATAVEAWTKDAKTELQEWLQARREPVPAYRIESTRGRQHDQIFVVACEVASRGLQTTGEGRSRRAAEQAAAAAALAKLSGPDATGA